MHVPAKSFGERWKSSIKVGRRSSGKEMSSTSCKITKLWKSRKDAAYPWRTSVCSTMRIKSYKPARLGVRRSWIKYTVTVGFPINVRRFYFMPAQRNCSFFFSRFYATFKASRQRVSKLRRIGALSSRKSRFQTRNFPEPFLNVPIHQSDGIRRSGFRRERKIENIFSRSIYVRATRRSVKQWRDFKREVTHRGGSRAHRWIAGVVRKHDRSDRQRASQSQRIFASRYRAIPDSANSFDARGRILGCNEGMSNACTQRRVLRGERMAYSCVRVAYRSRNRGESPVGTKWQSDQRGSLGG